MSSSTPLSTRGAGSQPQSVHWIAHVALVLAAALVTVISPSVLNRLSRPISLVLWAIAFVAVAVQIFSVRRFNLGEMTAGYAAALAAAALMFWSALGITPSQDVFLKSIGAVLFLTSAVLFLDARRRMR